MPTYDLYTSVSLVRIYRIEAETEEKALDIFDGDDRPDPIREDEEDESRPQIHRNWSKENASQKKTISDRIETSRLSGIPIIDEWHALESIELTPAEKFDISDSELASIEYDIDHGKWGK